MSKVKLNLPVAIGALVLVLLLLAFGAIWPDTASRVFADVQSWILDTFGWFYILSMAIFLVVAIVLALGRFGGLRLGPEESAPDYPFGTWLAMLFAAGMGIGLMYYAVAEPIQHFIEPPTAEPRTVEAQREAMVNTLFHWGLHAWAVYGVVGLSLAYFGYRYDLPLTIRSGLYPLLRNRINGPIGHAVDIFAICSTLFGVATSLGLGVLQINAGLGYLFDVPNSRTVQVILIVVVMGLAGVSVVTGLDVGIRRLSELNLVLAFCLMLFVLIVGPTVHLLNSYMQNLGLYLSSLVYQSLNMYAYEPTDWLKGSTLFFWAWWIAWSPFVGMFIARISRGRTVREFVLGVLLVPSAFTALWMTIFGNTALYLDTGKADGAISRSVADDISIALFRFFDFLPGTNIASGLAVLLIAVFFVTSADSGSLVVDTLAAGGEEDTPAYQRLFWVVLEAACAAILLVAGGLAALQTATIVAALPFAVVVLLLCAGLVRGMAADVAGREVMERHHTVPRVAGEAPRSWFHRLGVLLRPPGPDAVERFVTDTASPALREVAGEFERRGVEAGVDADDGRVSLKVPLESARDFVYGVEHATRPGFGLIMRDVSGRHAEQRRLHMALTFFSDGRRGYDVMGYTREQLIADALDQFDLYRAVIASPDTSLYVTVPENGDG